MINRFKELAGQASVYTLASFAGPFIGFFLLPIYTKVFSPEEYGIIDLISVTISFFLTIMIMGTDNGIGRIYYDGQDEIEKKVIASTGLIFQVIALGISSVVVIIFSREISQIIFRNDVYYFYIIFAILSSSLDRCFMICLNIFKYNFLSKKCSIISVAKMIMNVLLTILLVVYFKWGIKGVFASNLIISIIFSIIAIILCQKYILLSFSFKRLKEILIYGIPLVPYSFTIILLTSCDRFFLNHYSNLEQVGLYGFGARFGYIVTVIFDGTNSALAPFLFSSYHEKSTKLIYKKVVDYSIITCSIIVVGIGLFSKEIILLFTTNEYLGASSVMTILVAYQIFYNLGLRMGFGINISKKTVYFLWIALFTLITNVCLNFILVPDYGMIGASVATLISGIIWFSLLVYKSLKLYYIEYNFLSYLKVVIVSIVIMYIGCMCLLDLSLENVIIKILLIMLLVISIFTTGIISEYEIKYVKKWIASIF